MKHLGDITKINGALIEHVDVIVGGSPCQDLSVAGKRDGLDGRRSSLFMEQIRVIKEMRNATNNRAARYMVWENVPGAFSSNKAEDFRIVLEETARIADSNAVIPRPPKNKWATAGCIMGDGWSIAWRVQDAQFWGVPQRRRRIALVADFGGHTAPEILFERKGVSGNSTESRTERERAAGDVAHCFRETGIGYWGEGIGCLRAEGENRPSRPSNVIIYPDIARTLEARHDSSPCIDRGQNIVCQGFSYKASAGAGTIGCADNLAPSLLGARHDAAVVMESGQPNAGIEYDLSPTLNASHEQPIAFYQHKFGEYREGAGTLKTNCGQPSNGSGTLAVSVDCRNMNESEVHGTLQAKENGGQSLNYMGAVRTGFSVRRLTPLECERLQGYPDGWTDIPTYTKTVLIKRGKRKGELKTRTIKTSDSARYKALGNSIALPPWRFVLSRIHQHGARTFGSLFDGIGGFPLIWSELPETATLWASEIEPFPIAVTMQRFRKEQKNG